MSVDDTKGETFFRVESGLSYFAIGFIAGDSLDSLEPGVVKARGLNLSNISVSCQ